MDPAIQTNINGINTLTNRVTLLKVQVSLLAEALEAHDLGPLTDKQAEMAKLSKINAQRIAKIRENDQTEYIKTLKTELGYAKTRLGKLDTAFSEVKATQQAQFSELAGLKAAISENSEVILENAEEIKASEVEIAQVKAKAVQAMGQGNDNNINITLIRQKLDNTDRVVDGCIIGIDKNASNAALTNKNIELMALTSLKMSDLVKNLQSALKSVISALDLVRIQVGTNATNIRKR